MDPVTSETRRLLRRAWEGLHESLRTDRQFLGRHYVGCGATIGLSPRCDFTCRGCYLGDDANRAVPKPVPEILRQLRDLRGWLGHAGNVQITDGEATLRPEVELVAIIAHARKIGLVPMLMTHGETLRRRPGLLERLMEQGGLSEICFHVDTTMRGRPAPYARPEREEDLHALREEFAERIRAARRRTGRRLEAASTITVTRENLSQVPDVLRWFLDHSDAFKMASLLPAAQIGRTTPALGGKVGVEELWERIAQGVGMEREELLRGEGWLGHPGCSRFVQGLVVRRREKASAFHTLFRGDVESERSFLARLLDRMGGASFRLDGAPSAAARALRMFARYPGFLLGEALPQALRLWGRTSGGRSLALARDWLTGAAEIRYFNIVTHHFMSQDEIRTPIGRERLDNCAFKVAIDGSLVSMCEANALGNREQYYASASRTAPRRDHHGLAGSAGMGRSLRVQS